MNRRTLIIAEAGVNHNGSRDLAMQLVEAAADAGADVVKFQSFRAADLATANAPKAAYQAANTEGNGSQLAMLRALELSPSDQVALRDRCQGRAIGFMSTAFDATSLAFLATLEPPAFKIPSGDITCAPLLLQAGRLRKPLIVSTGMSTLAEVEQALGVIAHGLMSDEEPRSAADFADAFRDPAGRRALERHVTLLHCVTAYPAPPEAVNLRAMDTLASVFGLAVGYSDHTLGTDVALAAVARGACVIEKHYTLDRSLPGPDHAASLEPAELRSLVAGIRRVEQALGSTLKAPAPQELPNLPLARRSLVAARRIRKGEVFTAEMLAAKRPGTGISPMETWSLLGVPANREYAADEQIER